MKKVLLLFLAFLKKRYMPDFHKVETWFKIVLSLVIFCIMLILNMVYQKVEKVEQNHSKIEIVAKEIDEFRDSAQAKSVERDIQIDSLNRRVQAMQEVSIARDKELAQLQKEFKELRDNLPAALKKIDKFSAIQTVQFFESKPIKK